MTFINDLKGRALRPTTVSFYRLPDLCFITVQGEKALSFLQGQLTCDVQQVNAHTMQRGALCNLKGRILAMMDIVYQDNQYGLIMPAKLKDIVLKDLKLPAQLSRIQLTAQTHLSCFGIVVPEACRTDDLPFHLPANPRQVTKIDAFGFCYALSPGLYLCIGTKEALFGVTSLLDADAWHQCLMLHGRFSIYPETSGQFLPQPLQLEDSDVISFTKGCYKGQEIIARMHYQAKQKYQLVLTTLTSPHLIHPGMTLFSETDDTVLGEVVDASRLGSDQYLLLAMLHVAYAGNKTGIKARATGQ